MGQIQRGTKLDDHGKKILEEKILKNSDLQKSNGWNLQILHFAFTNYEESNANSVWRELKRKKVICEINRTDV